MDLSNASVIFDLDGTLADTSADLLAAANACFDELGLGVLLDLERDAGTALRGGKAMLRLGFSRAGREDEDEVARQYPRLLFHYGQNLDNHTRMYPGAMDAVHALRGRGYAVGICTNKPEHLAQELLIRLGVRDDFGALVGGDSLPVAKPDPAPFWETVRRLDGDPARSCLVGDSRTDRNTAKAAGVPSILVTFGPDGKQMEAMQPQALCHDFAMLPEIVERLLASG